MLPGQVFFNITSENVHLQSSKCHGTSQVQPSMPPGCKGVCGLQAVQAQQKALVSSHIRSLVCRHAGPVHAVTASPFDPGLVISAGLDGQVRVCSSLAGQPLLELTPSDSYLFSAQWSPHRPMLFAVGAGEATAFAAFEFTVEGTSAILLVCASMQCGLVARPD